jgi:DNA-binding NtrC family response regulator
VTAIYKPLENIVTLLVVSPLEEDHVSLRHIIGHSNWRLREASCCEEALRLLSNEPVPVVICECDLPDGNWKVFLDEVEKLPYPPHVIVSSRLADARLWAEVLNIGGYDVLMTPFDAKEVFHVVFSAWHSRKRSWEQTTVPSKGPSVAVSASESLGKTAAAGSAG